MIEIVKLSTFYPLVGSLDSSIENLIFTVKWGDFERRGDFEHFTKTNFGFS